MYEERVFFTPSLAIELNFRAIQPVRVPSVTARYDHKIILWKWNSPSSSCSLESASSQSATDAWSNRQCLNFISFSQFLQVDDVQRCEHHADHSQWVNSSGNRNLNGNRSGNRSIGLPYQCGLLFKQLNFNYWIAISEQSLGNRWIAKIDWFELVECHSDRRHNYPEFSESLLAEQLCLQSSLPDWSPWSHFKTISGAATWQHKAILW